MLRRPRSRRTLFRELETLETRRMLAAAAASVSLPGEFTNHVEEDKGLIRVFTPKYHVLGHIDSFLTGRRGGDRGAMARDYLISQAEALGVRPVDIEQATLVHRATETDTGITNVIFRQKLNGILIENTHMEVNFTRFGEVINAGGNFIPLDTAA
ncbi:MAG: hypothetical protein NZ561_06415, partial [Phycisphaerae bacterium]|nr:hypothetical protein [Phycisphaerae bacterium]MDW8261191.1 hypothetical protein [Phycisphaerales bacterium]